MPEYAVMTFMFAPWWKSGRLRHEQLLEGIAQCGARGVEPFHRDFVETPGLLKRYKAALADNGLRVAAVDILCNLVYNDAASLRRGRELLSQGLDIAGELGADIAHVAGHKTLPGVTAEDGRKMIAEGLLSVADTARAAGLKLAIEDFNPSPDLVCSAADCLDILHRTGDEVGFVFDTGNFIAVGENAAENFDRLADRIRHCHFKDFVKDPEHPNGYKSCDMGEGVIPNAEVARKLLERNYTGWVALETYGRETMDPVTAVRKELAVLRSWFEG